MSGENASIYSRFAKALSNAPQAQDNLDPGDKTGPLGKLSKIKSTMAKEESGLQHTKELFEFAQQEQPWDKPKVEKKIRAQLTEKLGGGGPPRPKTRKAVSTSEGSEAASNRIRNERKIKEYTKLTEQYPEVYGGVVKPSAPVTGKDSEEDVLRKLKEVESELNNSASKKYGKELMYMTVGSLEGLNDQLKLVSPQWARQDMRLQGMAQAMRAPKCKEALDPLFDEFMIKHDAFFSQSVELRLLLTIGQIASEVNYINHHPELYAKAQSAADADEVNDLLGKRQRA